MRARTRPWCRAGSGRSRWNRRTNPCESGEASRYVTPSTVPPLRRELALRALQQRRLDLTRFAPRRPEVEQHDLAVQRGQRARAAAVEPRERARGLGGGRTLRRRPPARRSCGSPTAPRRRRRAGPPGRCRRARRGSAARVDARPSRVDGAIFTGRRARGAARPRAAAEPFQVLESASCGDSSVGRASASQAEGRGFETRSPLFTTPPIATRGTSRGFFVA